MIQVSLLTIAAWTIYGLMFGLDFHPGYTAVGLFITAYVLGTTYLLKS